MRSVWFILAVVFAQAGSWAGEAFSGWNKAAAAKYLDERGRAWFAFSGADRGEGATKSSCVSCHTVLPFALGTAAIRKLSGESGPTGDEVKLIRQIKMRVDHWSEIDSPAFTLFYDSKEEKKRQSWGTEAVLNAFILARDDRTEGRIPPGDSTRRAFENLWRTQVTDGVQAGSWEWLNFGLEPFESNDGRYFGTTLAAIAVGTAYGTAYGHDATGAESAIYRNLEMLRQYLQANVAKQNLHNRAWLLWASARLTGILTAQQQKRIVAELLARQETDGGWRLASLGNYVRRDGTEQDLTSDGYATGLALYALQIAGAPRTDPKIANGLKWLMANQSATGEWRTSSVNKKRDPASNVGRFMSDTATGFAVLALSGEK